MHFLNRKLILEFLNEKSKVVWDCLFFGFILLSIVNPISYIYELFVLLYLIIPLILKLFEDSEDKIFDFPNLIRTPVVRNGKEATVGYMPEIWENWK